jgi:SAM-dependent methyltransferase
MTNRPNEPLFADNAGADEATLAAYDRGAISFAEDWSTQPAPTDMYESLRRFFTPGPTADIGCGAGRDTAWLDAHGFPATGYDASEGLLLEARRRYPHLTFEKALLPALGGVEDNRFRNILCETVIMHLPAGAIHEAVGRLISILKPGGTLYLSWRLAAADAARDAQGRRYTAFDPELVKNALGRADILMNEQPISASSGKPIRRIVARKPQNSVPATGATL